MLGALRLADVHTAKLIADGVIDQNSAVAALSEVAEACKSIHLDLASQFPALSVEVDPAMG